MKVQTRIAPANLEQWLDRHALSSAEIDCATAVMLKILDNKCKMNPEENSELDGLPLNLTCELTEEMRTHRTASSLILTNCHWEEK